MALSTAATEFRATLGALGLAQRRVARLFDVGERSIRRWQHGDRRVPYAVTLVCRLMAMGAVTIDQVEQAAVPRTNSRAKREPPAPLRAEPASNQSALAPRRAKTATFADGGPTTAEKVLALAEGSCRWPFNDPRHSGFRFCGRPIAEKGSYCKHHARLAYLPRRTGGGHGVRIGLLSARQDHGELVAHGPQPVPTHGRPSAPSALSATSAARPPSSQAAVSGSAPPPA